MQQFCTVSERNIFFYNMVNQKHIQLKIMLDGRKICMYAIEYIIFKVFRVSALFIHICPVGFVTDERLWGWAKSHQSCTVMDVKKCYMRKYMDFFLRKVE